MEGKILNQTVVEIKADLGYEDKSKDAQSLSQQVFKDADDFFKTLKQDIKQIPAEHSHDGSGITITGLKEFANQTTDKREKTAAEIAIRHFDDLSNISYKPVSRFGEANGFISENDIDFAVSMNHGETTGAILKGAAMDTFGSVVAGATGALSGVVGLSELATGESIFGGAAAFGVGLGWVGLGAIGVAAAGYFGYEAVTSRGRLNQMAADDQTMFKQWVSQ